MLKRLKVLLVEAHPLTRLGVQALLRDSPEFEICALVADAPTARQQCEMLKPDLVIVDGDGEEIGLIGELIHLHEDIRVLVVAPRTDPLVVHRAFRAGASGYVTLREEPAEILEAMRQVTSGHVFASREVSEHLVQQLAGGKMRVSTDKVNLLSDRELSVFRLLGEEHGMTALAQKLGISVKTAETHCRRIKQKLGLRDAAALHHRAAAWVRNHPEVNGRMLWEEPLPLNAGWSREGNCVER